MLTEPTASLHLRGAQTVSATKHGYTVDTHTVTIVEDETTTQNFNIALLPQVTVTGRIVGSDQPTVGLADATITLSGYEPYSATTNAKANSPSPTCLPARHINMWHLLLVTKWQPVKQW